MPGEFVRQHRVAKIYDPAKAGGHAGEQEFGNDKPPKNFGKTGVIPDVVVDGVDDDLGNLQKRDRDDRYEETDDSAGDYDLWRAGPNHPEDRRHSAESRQTFSPLGRWGLIFFASRTVHGWIYNLTIRFALSSTTPWV